MQEVVYRLVPTPGNGEGGRWPDKEGIYQAVSRHGLCQTAFNGDALKAQCSWLQEGITHWLEEAPQQPVVRGDLPRFVVKEWEGHFYPCDTWAVNVLSLDPDFEGAIAKFDSRDIADSIVKYLNKHEGYFTPPAKSPFAEWAGVPVNKETLGANPLFDYNSFGGFFPKGSDELFIEVRKTRIIVQNDNVGITIHPRDLAHLCEVIVALDPAAFEKGGEG